MAHDPRMATELLFRDDACLRTATARVIAAHDRERSTAGNEVLPREPLCKWVFTVPLPLRYLFATEPVAMGAMLGIVYRGIAEHLLPSAVPWKGCSDIPSPTALPSVRARAARRWRCRLSRQKPQRGRRATSPLSSSITGRSISCGPSRAPRPPGVSQTALKFSGQHALERRILKRQLRVQPLEPGVLGLDFLMTAPVNCAEFPGITAP